MFVLSLKKDENVFASVNQPFSRLPQIKRDVSILKKALILKFYITKNFFKYF